MYINIQHIKMSHSSPECWRPQLSNDISDSMRTASPFNNIVFWNYGNTLFPTQMVSMPTKICDMSTLSLVTSMLNMVKFGLKLMKLVRSLPYSGILSVIVHDFALTHLWIVIDLNWHKLYQQFSTESLTSLCFSSVRADQGESTLFSLRR